MRMTTAGEYSWAAGLCLEEEEEEEEEGKVAVEEDAGEDVDENRIVHVDCIQCLQIERKVRKWKLQFSRTSERRWPT